MTSSPTDDNISLTTATESFISIDRSASGFSLGPYIDRKGAKSLKEHKYAGCDDGFFYHYFYSPLATYLVHKLPEWLAPNTITIIGYLHTFGPIAVLYCCIGCSLIGDLPNWFLFLQGWCYFVYRVLDEMDGK